MNVAPFVAQYQGVLRWIENTADDFAELAQNADRRELENSAQTGLRSGS